MQITVGSYILYISCNIKKYDTVLELDQGYVPHKLEPFNKNKNYFKPPVKISKPFTLVLPPPNITGTLHLGHALTATVQDVIIRW